MTYPDDVDKRLELAENDAGLFQSHAGHGHKSTVPATEEYESKALTPDSKSQDPYQKSTADGNRVERVESLASSGYGSDERRDPNEMSRMETQRDAQSSALERNETALSRIATQRTQHSQTVGGALATRKTTKPLPNFGAGKPYPPLLPEREEYVVEFDGADDPLNAMNWPLRRKLTTAAILGYTTFIAAFGSSIFSAALNEVAAEFHVSREVGVLGVSLYVLGFATGPILWAPFSELKGRRMPIVIASFGFLVFNFAVAVAKDLQTVMICRFWSGFFGACPLAVVAAVFSDMFDNRYRGVAVAVFSVTVFSGPLMAPFIGGFIVLNRSLGWRWTEYITGILASLAFVLNLFFLKETYPPMILVTKAEELRRRTKNWGIHAKQEEIELDLQQLLEKNFTRPLRMLVTEPIVLLLSLYMSFIYGLLYLFLTAYPLVFQRVHGFNAGIGGLPYFGMILGEVLAALTMILRQPGYNKKLSANGGMPIPEWRLPEMIAGGVAFSAGLFWFGWTGYTRSIHWIVPTLSGLLTGFGLMAIFLQALNYLVDAYLMFAASAIAANTFLRSLFGAAFPLFALYMFDGMGIQWASTLLGCVAAVLVPVPIYFLFKGAEIRKKSAFAPTFPPKAAAPPSDADDVEKNA